MNQRIARLQSMMAADGVEGLLYATSANLQYFLDDTTFPWQRTMDTGGVDGVLIDGKDISSSGASHFLNMPDLLLYVPAADEPMLFMTPQRARTMEHIQMKKRIDYFVMLPERVGEVIKGKKRIAYGESCGAYLKDRVIGETDSSIEAVSGERYGELLRRIKDPGEIQKLRRAAAFTDETMGIIVKHLKAGVSSNQIEDLIIRLGVEKGLGDIPFPPTCRYVHTGSPESEDLDGHDENAPMEEGTSVGFDYGYVMDGYCSDFGRSFYYGKNKDASDGYKALMEAQLRLLDAIKPGIPMSLCFNSLYATMSQFSQEKWLRKYGDFGLMGHQIGIDVHERPWLHTDQTAIFEPGMVMCIEPKFWRPGVGFMRVEDMVLITETGCESLTKFDRELFELG